VLYIVNRVTILAVLGSIGASFSLGVVKWTGVLV